MTIGFEAKRLFTNYTGLGNYSRFILNALSDFASDNQYYLYTPKKVVNKETQSIIERPNVRVFNPSSLYKVTHTTSVWRTWGISREPSIHDLQVFHGLSHELPLNLPKKIKKVLTVHDLIFYRFPELYKAVDVAIYKRKLTHACNKADVIVAISEQTSQDLQQFLKIEPSKIKVIYQGCHPSFKRSVSHEEKLAIKTKYNLPDQYILNVGTIERRKNARLIVEAVSQLPEDLQLPVVFMGKPTSYKQEIVDMALKRNLMHKIHFIHGASFYDFPAIYQQATVFVYPSLFEGFGIPLVEAIQSNVPVITSKGSCFIEAAGPDAMYVDPHRAEELAEALIKSLDASSKEKMITGQKQFIQKFTPSIIANDLSQLYRSL